MLFLHAIVTGIGNSHLRYTVAPLCVPCTEPSEVSSSEAKEQATMQNISEPISPKTSSEVAEDQKRINKMSKSSENSLQSNVCLHVLYT